MTDEELLLRRLALDPAVVCDVLEHHLTDIEAFVHHVRGWQSRPA